MQQIEHLMPLIKIDALIRVWILLSCKERFYAVFLFIRCLYNSKLNATKITIFLIYNCLYEQNIGTKSLISNFFYLKANTFGYFFTSLGLIFSIDNGVI